MSTDLFSPTGPNSALIEAISILSPSGSQRLKGKHRTKLRRTPGFVSKFDLTAHGEELEMCRRIGSEYQENLRRHDDTTRLSEFFAQFREMQRLSDRLSNLLSGLRSDARFLLHTFFDDDEEVFERLANVRSQVEGLPDPITNAPGQLADELRALSSYLVTYIPVLEERFGGKQRKFRTNSPTVGKLTTPSPIWALIGEAWKLFRNYPHLNPSGSADGDLREFVHAIHLWVTGDATRNLAKAVKKYASYKNRQAILQEELARLGSPKPVPRSRGNKRIAAAPRPMALIHHAVERELAELELRLHFEFFPTEKRN